VHAELTAGDADQHLSLTTSGAEVPVAPCRDRPFFTVQTTCPVLASSATRVVSPDAGRSCRRLGDTAIDGIAAHHRNDVGVRFGSYFQTILFSFARSSRIDLVGENGV